MAGKVQQCLLRDHDLPRRGSVDVCAAKRAPKRGTYYERALDVMADMDMPMRAKSASVFRARTIHFDLIKSLKVERGLTEREKDLVGISPVDTW